MRWWVLGLVAVAGHVAAQDSTTKAFVAAGQPGTVTQWEEGPLRRIAVRRETATGPWALEFYLRNDSLLRVFDQAPDGVENQYLFEEGRLARWIARMAPDAPEFEQDPEDAAYLDAGIRVPELARCWVRFLHSPDANWTRWGEETGCAFL